MLMHLLETCGVIILSIVEQDAAVSSRSTTSYFQKRRAHRLSQTGLNQSVRASEFK